MSGMETEAVMEHMCPAFFLKNRAACCHALATLIESIDEDERHSFRYLKLDDRVAALFYGYLQESGAVSANFGEPVPYFRPSEYDFYMW